MFSHTRSLLAHFHKPYYHYINLFIYYPENYIQQYRQHDTQQYCRRQRKETRKITALNDNVSRQMANARHFANQHHRDTDYRKQHTNQKQPLA
jgi:hypothetical protein